MTEASIKMLDKLCGEMGTGIDWSKPDNVSTLNSLMDNYISYKIVNSILWIAVFAATLLLTLLVAYIIKRTHSKLTPDKINEREFLESIMGGTVVAIAVSATILVVVIAYQAFHIAQYLTFPEKTILEYLKSLQGA